MSARYRGIGSALYVREEEDGEWRVMQTTIPLDDADVAAELQAAMGGTWTQITDWAVPEGEIGKRAIWSRVELDGGPPTTPAPPPEGEAVELPIPAGKAHLYVAGAFLDLFTAMHRLEAICSAVARQLDAGNGTP